jgi:hypothetical protein
MRVYRKDIGMQIATKPQSPWAFITFYKNYKL